jgi:hypothetical protein
MELQELWFGRNLKYVVKVIHMDETRVNPFHEELQSHKVEEYQRLHERVLVLKQEIGRSFWEMGKVLKTIRDEELYKAGDYDTFEAYLGSPEVSIDRSTAYDWIGIFEDFSALNVGLSDIQDIEWSKLRKLRPVVRAHPEQLQEWLTKARTLSRSDLAKELGVSRARAKPTAREAVPRGVRSY